MKAIAIDGPDGSRSVSLSDLRRALAALVLASRVDRARLTGLVDFVRALLEEASRDPPAFAGWLNGALVVDLRRDEGGGVTMVLVIDDGLTFGDVLSCRFEHLSFAAIARLLQSAPELVSPLFVLVEDDALSLFSVRYVDEPAPEGAEEAQTGPPPLDEPWDPDATVVSIRPAHETPTPPSEDADPADTLILAPSEGLLRQLRGQPSLPREARDGSLPDR